MMSPLEEKYEQNLFRMKSNESRFRTLLWAYIGLGALFAAFALIVVTYIGNNPNIDAPYKWSEGIYSGFIQFGLGLATIILGFFGCMKKKIPLMLHIGIMAVLIISCILGKVAGGVGDFLFGCIGLVLDAFGLAGIKEDEALQNEEGYPHFTLRLDQSNEYIPSPVVQNRVASEDMDTLALPSDMPDIGMESTAPNREQSAFPHPSEANPEHISPDLVLSEMSATDPSHIFGHSDLPDPEEVKERMRKMQEEQNKFSTM